MDMKECIEFLKNKKYIPANYAWMGENNKIIDEIIKRLQIWEDFKEGYGFVWSCEKGAEVRTLMDKFEKRYFLKELKMEDIILKKNLKKKTITIDIEADEVSYQEFLIRLKMLEAPMDIGKKFIKMDIKETK